MSFYELTALVSHTQPHCAAIPFVITSPHFQNILNMVAPTDTLDDWITYPYVEKGQYFTVVQRKDIPRKDDLSDDGPFESMIRKDRYLVPTNMYRDVVLVPSITGEMFERQRKELMFRSGDIVITTYPRSGTTWTEQLVLLMLTKGDPTPLNTKRKNAYHASEPQNVGKVFLDALYHETPTEDICQPWGMGNGQDLTLTRKEVDEISFRRVFKTHHRAHMMIGMGEAREALDKQEIPPFVVPGVKFLWVLRDPKDTALSMMKINTTNYAAQGFPLTPFIKAFLEGKTNRGSWTDHAREWYECYKQHPDNVLPVSYEDSKKDPHAAAKRIAEFLEIDLTDEELENCVKHSSFASMKEMSKGAKSAHILQGRVGGWREQYSPDMIEGFNKMCSDPRLGEFGSRYVVRDA